jgi:hypothetical protein
MRCIPRSACRRPPLHEHVFPNEAWNLLSSIAQDDGKKVDVAGHPL